MIGNSRLFSKILFGIIFHVSILLSAQDHPPVIVKSEQKVIYQGKIYYIHTVKHGHTLYSICRTYNVTEQDIRKANPSATLNPLSIGQTLRIPYLEKTDNVSNKDLYSTNEESKYFIIHTVEPKQTIFFLHQKYNVPITAIYRYNPGTEDGLETGQIVKIPKKHLLERQEPDALQPQEKYILYTVQQGDTLYRIAQDHGISISALIDANNNLRWGLKTGQVIKIPLEEVYLALTYQTVVDSILLVSEMKKLSTRQCDSIASVKRMRTPVKVALILPFFASERIVSDTTAYNDTLTAKKNRKKSKIFKGRGAAEFYEGLLLAVDSLKKIDVDINLFVYDSEANTNKVKRVISDLEIINPDLILGPFLPKNIALVNRFSIENQIPFVPPLMKDDSTLKHNSYLFQVMPPQTSEMEIYADVISQYYDQNIIIVYKKSMFKQKEVDKFKRIMSDRFTTFSDSDSLILSEVYIDDSLQHSLERHMKDSITNIVIVSSSYEPEVSDVLTKLYYIHQTRHVKVFGMQSWQKFKSVRIDHFHDLEVTLYSPFYIDYNSPIVKSFVLKCRSKLTYEPYLTTSKGTGINYTFLGYDLGMYFIAALNKFGEQTCDCASYFQPELILSSYAYKRNKQFGYNENKSISLVRYKEDLSIESLKIDASQYREFR